MINRERLKALFKLPPQGIYNGKLVVSFENHVSGPVASEELARKGALVIKVESEATAGDPARRYLNQEVFTTLNAAKASLKLSNYLEKTDNISNLDHSMKHYYSDLSDKLILLLLADVIIDNRSPGAKKNDQDLQKFFMMAKRHPVIYCSIVGYDSESFPEAALDVSVQAATGMAVTNSPSAASSPLKVGYTVLDITSGREAAAAIKEALYAIKAEYEIPEHLKNVINIEISMAKVSAMLQCGQYLNYLVNQKEERREGNRDKFIAPFSFYQAQDKSISLGIISDEQFNRFCTHVIERKDLCNQFPTNELRLKHVEKLETELNAIFIKKSGQFWIDRCKKFGISCGPVNSIAEALKEPFAKNMVLKTQDEVKIIANPDSSIFSNEDKLHGAPKFNQHHEHIRDLLIFHKQYPDNGFSQLRKKILTPQNLLFQPAEKSQGKKAGVAVSYEPLRSSI